MIDTYNSLSPIFLNFTMINVQTIFNELFCPVCENSEITRSSNKKLKVPF